MGLFILLSVCGCVSETVLAPTPAIYTQAGPRTQFRTAAATQGPGTGSLLYVTDRAPVIGPDGALAYGSDRSRQMSFGSVAIDVVRSGGSGELHVGAIRKSGEFPRTPYPMQARQDGFRRSPQAVSAHEQAVSGLQAEVARRLALTQRKELVIFIHGYNNSFEDAVRSTGNLCQFLGEEFVCVVLSWPAGGSRGALLGYNVDRESGEFAVSDMRKAIRAIAETPGVRKAHLMAHSRGRDVMTSALQQLGIESHVAGTSLSSRLKVANILLFAPDMDLDVAAARIFTVGSDPDLPVGRAPRPSATFQQGDVHLTVYSSPNDQALGLSGLLFGSIIRLGQLATTRDDPRLKTDVPDFAGMIDFIEVPESGGLIGHDYFLSNPKVSGDVVALVRYGLKPNEPGRRLVEITRPFWRIARDGGP
jgi:esterase/lipase superfamily enzyme